MASRKKHLQEGRLFAIGDIHGCVDELATMLKAIAPVRGDTVVFVGDYVDRGPCARAVLDLMLELETGEAEYVFLKGNHEDMMLGFLGLEGHYAESFLMNGGAQTLESYGITEETLDCVPTQMPERHVSFLKNLATSYLRPPYLFVHAGVLPTRTLEEQSVEDMLWIRQEFIFHPHQLDSIVVFGHTPMRSVLVDLPSKMGIDTGLVYGGKLSCVEFVEGVLYQVARGSRQAKSQSIEVR
jgi:serine/threonine protein phosphatase 1